MNASDLATLAANAGFSGSDINVAAAIALAESSGNPNAYNPVARKNTPQGQGAIGLWQIYLWKHPEFAGQNLYDPQTNANAAFAVYQRSGFNAWETYTTGAYLKYIQAVAATTPPLTIDASTGQPVDSNVDTSTLPPAVVTSGVWGTGLSKGQVLLLTGLGIAVYVVAETLAD